MAKKKVESEDLERIDYAWRVFVAMQRGHSVGLFEEVYGNIVIVPKNLSEVMGIAAFCAIELKSLGDKKLRELERKKVIHNSTVSGGSLDCTLNILRDYFIGRGTLWPVKEHCKHLRHTCRSARRIIEKGLCFSL